MTRLTVFALLMSLSSAAFASENTKVAAATHADVAGLPFGQSSGVPAAQPKSDATTELGVLEEQLSQAGRLAGAGALDDEARAFALYQRIVKENADVRPGALKARGVAQAYVALGVFYRNGLEGVVSVNTARAASLLHYAASYYGDADAQCDLADMYLKGDGVTKNERLAANWLANAAKKRHARAQALLGDLLMRGSGDLSPQPEKGLALLFLARQNASSEAEARWIDRLYEGAHSRAEPVMLEQSKRYIDAWQERYGPANKIISITSTPADSADADASAAASGVVQVGLDQAPIAY